MTGSTIRILCLAAAVATAVSACTVAGGETPQATDDVVQPTASAPATLGPITEQPRDSRSVDGPSFSLFAPAEFQQSSRSGPGGAQMIVLDKPSSSPGGVIEVVAFEEKDPPSGVREQMAAVAAEKADLEGVTDLRRESIEWPGAVEAVIMQWTEKTSTADGSITQRFAQLAAQVNDRLIATVVAVAPTEEFESSQVLEVLRSLALDSA
jgi:hypothetical protein